jgi:hypothetical protein
MYPALHRMETSLMSFGRKAAVAAVAFATVGSTLFGGVALAGDDKGYGRPPADDKKVVKVHKKDVDATAGRGGDAGQNVEKCIALLSANVNLLNFHSPDNNQAAGCANAGDNTGGSPTAYNEFN